ncbi:MAG TPA: hypothetical protein VFB39_07840 [Solirubrobacteraceae bacterium]|nr:hypothetical protein [Solirubrobacteraceae bacterium]
MPQRTRPALVARRAFAWSLGWVCAAALYLLLIDITDLPELIVGAGAAVLAATGLELAREQGIVGESVRWRWLLRLHRPLLRIPRDVAVVSAMALRAIVRRKPAFGTFRAVPFGCDEQEPYETGRRALAEAAGSVAPNTFVVGVDGERQLILAHQLRPTGGRETIDPLELG